LIVENHSIAPFVLRTDNGCLPTPGHQDLDTLSEPGRVRSKNFVGLLMTLG
jgi:hypothetical protein